MTDPSKELLTAVAAATAGDEVDAQIAERARTLIDEVRQESPSDALEGMLHMRNLSMALGLPVPRILFDALVNASPASNSKKKKWRSKLANMTEITETGCIQIDFLDITTGLPNSAYLVLDECSPAHDLSAELDKIYSRIPVPKQDEIRRHLSMLVHLGRNSYTAMLYKMKDLLAEIGDNIDYSALGIDYANTTIYLPQLSEHRVGIFVRLQQEVTEKTSDGH